MTARRKLSLDRAAALALSTVAAAALGACGAGGGSSGASQAAGGSQAPGVRLARPTKATLALDFLPNAIHAGIYRAIAAGYYGRNNIELTVIQPTSTADTLRLIDSGKADFGLADGSDVADQIGRGRDAKAIMAVVQRPLGGVIALARERLRSPRQLEGGTVGLTGVPSDTAVLDTVVRHAGGDPHKLKTVVIGFNGVPDLENGVLAAFTGFWPADGVQVSLSGHPTTVFRLEQNGGPAYPGLVAFSTQSQIAREPALMRAFVAATVHGYEDTLANPPRSLRDLLRLNPALKPALANASLRAYLPLFVDGAQRYGVLRADKLTALSGWMLANGLIKRAIAPSRFGTNQFLASAP